MINFIRKQIKTSNPLLDLKKLTYCHLSQPLLFELSVRVAVNECILKFYVLIWPNSNILLGKGMTLKHPDIHTEPRNLDRNVLCSQIIKV